jgi:DNA-binding transcriptional MerR regulator
MSGYRPGEAAAQLGIAAPTLRRWSVQFADYLDAGASAAIAQDGGGVERRYSDRDIALLRRVSGLLARGLTYEQVRRQIGEQEPGATLAPAPDASMVLVELASAQRETIAAQRETIGYLKAELERVRAEQERQRLHYLGIIRKLIERLQG